MAEMRLIGERTASARAALRSVFATAAEPRRAAAARTAPNAPRAGQIVVDHATLTTGAGKRLLDDVSLAIARGEKLAVVGPNGAGKTTLLRLLFGAAVPTGGSVRLDGVPLHRLPPVERARHIAVVSQSAAPDLRLTVRDYVELGRIPHRGRVSAAAHRDAVGRALDRVGLAALAERRLGHLSGGERQRAGIARAVAQEPAVLLLDEPTNHLDPRARADMLDLAASLAGTVIAILHDLDRVAAFADRVAVMAHGRLVAHAAPAEALAPATVRAVFDMECFPVVNPASGRRFIVFDTPVGVARPHQGHSTDAA